MIALLRIAIDEENIVENPMNGIYIKAKFRAVRKKSDGSKLYIIRKARELNPDGEFIFERNGERLTARAVTYWISKYYRDAGITYKSPHCTRRTTASRLGTEGMPLDKIREILGQVDERTS